MNMRIERWSHRVQRPLCLLLALGLIAAANCRPALPKFGISVIPIQLGEGFDTLGCSMGLDVAMILTAFWLSETDESSFQYLQGSTYRIGPDTNCQAFAVDPARPRATVEHMIHVPSGVLVFCAYRDPLPTAEMSEFCRTLRDDLASLNCRRDLEEQLRVYYRSPTDSCIDILFRAKFLEDSREIVVTCEQVSMSD